MGWAADRPAAAALFFRGADDFWVVSSGGFKGHCHFGLSVSGKTSYGFPADIFQSGKGSLPVRGGRTDDDGGRN
jgi:hypothetical protein